MRTLTWLMEHQLRKLTRAQFKLAAYLYGRLQRHPELTIRTKDLAEAIGLSVGSAQAASNGLAKQGILLVEGGPGKTKTYRLPAARPRKAKPGAFKTVALAKPPSAQPTPAQAQPTIKPAVVKKKAKRVPSQVAPSEQRTVFDILE